MQSVRRLATWHGLICLMAVAGCNNGQLSTYPVSGDVSIKGAGALTVGEVVFTSDKVTAKGAIKEDGSYSLTTYKENDGAPPGKYQVATYFQPDFESGAMKQFPEANKWKPAQQEVIVRGDTEVTVQMESTNPN